jgi:hypothetical protein
MLSWREIFPYGQGGLVVTALAVACAALLRNRAASSRSPSLIYAAAGLVLFPLGGELVLSTWYLLSPTYVDHIEASAASVAQYFLQGVPIYPATDTYTFHALVYGPLLAEANAVGYLFASGVVASKLVGWAAAWIAVTVLLLTEPPGRRNWAWTVANACALCVLVSFGPVLTADRADSLLLLCAVLALFGVTRLPAFPGLALAAAAAGAAAALKLHGPLYVLPALCIWLYVRGRPRHWLVTFLVAAGAGIAAALLPFLPQNVTFAGYLTYLKLAAHHGLSWELLKENLAFVAGLWAPILLTWRIVPGIADPPSESGRSAVRLAAFWPLALLAAELLVAVIGSKPGAGVHHLLPFLGYHAFLLQYLLERAGLDSAKTRRAGLACLAAVLIGTAWPAGSLLRYFLEFDLRIPEQQAAHAELEQWAALYPRGMMGITDWSTYWLTSLRPWLTLRGIPQTDYAALMDWTLSGVSDTPLAHALERCEIPDLFIPKGGEPFTMVNGYGGPLFSNAVRESFARHYSTLESGRYFDVFGCSGPFR